MPRAVFTMGRSPRETVAIQALIRNRTNIAHFELQLGRPGFVLTEIPSQTVLVLQGGGALGAFECGVIKALEERGIHPQSHNGTVAAQEEEPMQLDTDRIDEAVLALLRLGLHEGDRAWKSFDWDAMGRLHEKGLISDPVGKAKSVVFTEEGLREAERLLYSLFCKEDS